MSTQADKVAGAPPERDTSHADDPAAEPAHADDQTVEPDPQDDVADDADGADDTSEQDGEGEEIDPPLPPPTDPRTLRIRILEATLAERENTLHEYIRAHKKSKTEFDAFRERLTTEQQEVVAQAKRKLVERLLPVQDNLTRSLAAADAGGTLESLRDGVAIVAREFLKQLEELGLERFDPTGEVFDPSSMEALGVVPVADAGQDGRVVLVIQPGFKLQGREIRPALVQVGRKI